MHYNSYVVDDTLTVDGNTTSSTASLYVALADNVLLVPVVVIRLKDEVRGQPQDETALRVLFDYEPLQATVSEATLGSGAHHNPEEYWYPPDDIWDQCWTRYQLAPIQFRVLRVATLTVPYGVECINNPTGTCNGASASDFWRNGEWSTDKTAPSGLDLIESKLATVMPDFNEVKSADPIYVTFGNAASEFCDHSGKACALGGDAKEVEIDADARLFGVADPVTVAHELGHALGLDHVHGVTTNLMNDGTKGIDLTADQCKQATSIASTKDQAYRAYNDAIGRAPLPLGIAEDGHESDREVLVRSCRLASRAASGDRWWGLEGRSNRDLERSNRLHVERKPWPGARSTQGRLARNGCRACRRDHPTCIPPGACLDRERGALRVAAGAVPIPQGCVDAWHRTRASMLIDRLHSDGPAIACSCGRWIK